MVPRPGLDPFDDDPDLTPREQAREDLARGLGEAIDAGDDAAVRGLLADNPGCVRELGDTAQMFLIHAIEQGRVGAVAALLEAGARAHDVEESGGTPLMEAAWHGRPEIARLLLAAGADPDALASQEGDRDYDDSIAGRCALHFAQLRGHGDLVDLLTPLTRPEVRELADRATARERERIAAEPPPPPPEVQELFRAVRANDAAGVRAALAAGAGVEVPDRAGSLPLWTAAAGDKLAALLVLLEAGAEVDAVGEGDGYLEPTALGIATRLNRPNVMAPLLAAGADPARVDWSGQTVWESGARTGGAESLRRAWREVHGGEPPA